ncbi:MAG: enoyl-CoA hydratase/isomerase family protein [Deltaproteobacteria bacterium]|nr:enoyl-CoA hydratase/isomerase family protein [Deltaproteobacteria bacterium]
MIDLETLHLGAADGVATLRIDHGKANEMGRQQIGEWERLCDWLETAPAGALISYSDRLSPRGAPIFIAGANVTERGEWSTGEVKAHVRRQRAVLARLRRVPVFHVGVIHGVALGWGTEFTLTCDWRIATPGAKFALPETGLGILPGAGGASELAAVVGPNQALRLGITGESVGAEDAARIGLVDELAADLAAGLERARALAARVALRSPTAVAAYKAAVLAALGQGTEARRDIEARAYEHCIDSGEAAVGRANFATITAGTGRAPWGNYTPWKP